MNSREFLLFQSLSFFFSFSQVGLAVGDIESVQKYAFLRNKGKFVDFVVGVERNLPKFVTRRLHKPELVVTGRYVDRKISSGWVSSYWGADRVFWLWLLLRLFERKAQSPSTVLGRTAFSKTTSVHDQLLLLSSSQKLFRRIKLKFLKIFLSRIKRTKLVGSDEGRSWPSPIFKVYWKLPCFSIKRTGDQKTNM